MDSLFIEINNMTIRELLSLYHVGKKKIYDLFVKRAIFYNGENCSYDQKLKGQIEIRLDLYEENNVKPAKGILNIVYEDNDILIINKPKKILIHDDGNNQATLCGLVSAYYLKKGLKRGIYYVHRLDFETTGIILFAKHFLAEAKLCYMMEADLINRYYLCLCQGKLEKGIINKKIGRDRHDQRKMICSSTGKDAITHYKKVKGNDIFSLCEVKLDTGRTHQIRVHFKSIGHPLLGDKLYGGDCSLISRVALHSYKILFKHPITNNELRIEIPLPKDMEEIANEI